MKNVSTLIYILLNNILRFNYRGLVVKGDSKAEYSVLRRIRLVEVAEQAIEEAVATR